MQVNREMLENMLDAALSTARTHRGRQEELYALGQLEATANMVYVMICCQTSEELSRLEVRCQACALEAIERMEKISGGSYELSHVQSQPVRRATRR